MSLLEEKKKEKKKKKKKKKKGKGLSARDAALFEGKPCVRNCAMPRGKLRAHRVRLCAREKITGSKFDLLSEVIFKDLAVIRKLVCPS